MPEQYPPANNKRTLPVVLALGAIIIIGFLVGPKLFRGSPAEKSPGTVSVVEAEPAQASASSQTPAPPSPPAAVASSPGPEAVARADSGQVTAYLSWLQAFNSERLQYDANTAREIQEKTAQFQSDMTRNQVSLTPTQLRDLTARVTFQYKTDLQKVYKGMASALKQANVPASCASVHATYLNWINATVESMGHTGFTLRPHEADAGKTPATEEAQAKQSVLETQFKQQLEALRTQYPQVNAESFQIPLTAQ